MKTTNKLKPLYDKAKGDNKYYSFDNFLYDAKRFIKDCRNRETICSMTVSKSGMTRHFNFAKGYNMLLNILYNDKFTYDPVKVGGCGMDMHWNLKFRACEELCTKKEMDKWSLNAMCSSGEML